MSRATRSSPFDPEQALAEAKLLLDQKHRWSEAEELAQRVIDESPGGVTASEARQVLRRIDGATGSRRRDPETSAARSAWVVLTGLDDGRLPGAWERATANPRRIGDLRSELERSLERWIRELTADLGEYPELAGAGRRLEVLDSLARSEPFGEHLELALRDALDELELVRFRWKLAREERGIRLALGRWDVAEAERLLDVLGEPPPGLEDDTVLGFRRELQVIDDRRRSVDELVSALPRGERPASWKELRQSLELIAEGEREKTGLPPSFENELQAALEEARKQILAFVEKEAGRATSPEKVRELCRHLESFDSRFEAANLEIGARPLEPALEILDRAWHDEIRRAAEPKELEALEGKIASEGISLPPSLKERARRWSERSCDLARIWRSVRLGEPVDPLPADASPELQAEHEEAVEIEKRLGVGFALLESTPSLAQARRAGRTAKEVLAEHSGHREAQRLARMAEEIELGLNLEQELGRIGSEEFDLEGYVLVASSDAAPEDHGVLGNKPQVLTQLAEHLSRKPFETAAEAMGWWIGFSQSVRALPEPPVAWLERRVHDEIRDRMAQSLLILDRAQTEDRSAEEWRELADDLSTVSGDPLFDPDGALELRRKELTLRSRLTKVEKALDDGHFAVAETLLEEIEDDGRRRSRLEVRLAIESADAAEDLEKLAETFDRYWGLATEIYGEGATARLARALDDAWKAQEHGPLGTLLSVGRRARRDADSDSQAGRRLDRWITWLELENELEDEISPLKVIPLLEHLEELDVGTRRARAERLLAGWRGSESRFSLAWAFRALPELRHDLFPDAVDPVDGLAMEVERFVAEVDAWSKRRRAGDEEPTEWIGETAGSLSARGEELRHEIQELDHLLDEVPFGVDRFRPPSSFGEALRSAEKVLRILRYLDELEASDLRKERDRCRRARILIRELQAPWRKHLVERIEKIEPLTRLDYFENRLLEAAERCADPEHLDAPGVFQAVADAIRIVEGELERAGFSRAPVARAIARDYWSRLPAAADVAAPDDGESLAGLDEMVRHFESLEAEDRLFGEALEALKDREPPIGAAGAVEARRHRAYFDLLPEDEPRSHRIRRLLDRFLGFGDRRRLFEEGTRAGLLPSWFVDLQRGVSR